LRHDHLYSPPLQGANKSSAVRQLPPQIVARHLLGGQSNADGRAPGSGPAHFAGEPAGAATNVIFYQHTNGGAEMPTARLAR